MPADELSGLIDVVAKELLGDPNPRLSSEYEMRYGRNGSLSVDLKRGIWFDHEAGQGGGVLDLITRETGLEGSERLQWLEQHGFSLRAEGNGRYRERIMVETYDYTDEAGHLLFQVCRYDPKTFSQRSPDGNGGWIPSVKGIRQVPYRLPEVLEAISTGKAIVIPEGERDVDNLWKRGIPATCNAGGAGKWRPVLDRSFVDADIIVICDNDEPGHKHAHAVCQELKPVASRVRLLDLKTVWPACPVKGDISDWLEAGGTVEQLNVLFDELRDFDPDAVDESVLGIATETPFPGLKAEDIPTRPWLIPGLLLRRQVSLLVAPAGSGKSLLTLQLSLLCASGIAHWSGWHPRGQYRVLLVNAEEDEDEQKRRLFAAAKVMELDANKLAGLHMAREPDSIVIATTDGRTHNVIRTPMLERIIHTIIAQQIDIVVVDPFAETFIGDENSNNELKWAAILWREVARRTNSAVFLVHHARKYSHAMAGDVDAARGASALIGVARIVSTLFAMTQDEFDAMKIKDGERTDYLRYDDAKANLTKITPRAKWFKKISYQLPNAANGDPADEVGVLMPWLPPDVLAGLDSTRTKKILDEIDFGVVDDDGRPTGRLFSLTKRGGSGRWAGDVIIRHLDCSDADAKHILRKWLENNVIEEVETKSHKGSRAMGVRSTGSMPGVPPAEEMAQDRDTVIEDEFL